MNVPDARQIAVVDLASGKQSAAWTVPDLAANFPLAIDGRDALAVAFRKPPRLVLLATESAR